MHELISLDDSPLGSGERQLRPDQNRERSTGLETRDPYLGKVMPGRLEPLETRALE
jgi:hypothetical protein